MGAPAHIGKHPRGARIIRGEGATDGQHALQRTFDVGIVIPRHEADRTRLTEAFEKRAGRVPFRRQPDIGEIAGARDVIRRLVANITHESCEAAPYRARGSRPRCQLMKPVRRLPINSRRRGRGSGPTCGSERWAMRNMVLVNVVIPSEFARWRGKVKPKRACGFAFPSLRCIFGSRHPGRQAAVRRGVSMNPLLRIPLHIYWRFTRGMTLGVRALVF